VGDARGHDGGDVDRREVTVGVDVLAGRQTVGDEVEVIHNALPLLFSLRGALKGLISHVEPAAMGRDDLEDARVEELSRIAGQAAAGASRDAEVIADAVAHMREQLYAYACALSDDPRKVENWARVVARNAARRIGAKQAREAPMGRQGSDLPPLDDGQLEARVRDVLDLGIGGQPSLGSLVADKLWFEERFVLLSDETRELLRFKYVEGWSAKEIAARLGVEPGAVDQRLYRARRAAAEIFADAGDDDGLQH
jgi:RNA polymerase sigma factor (sigma-70 family)